RCMVVAAHPLAARAGVDAIRSGGSALDAAIAAELVLGLVEPQSSGLGGGAFLLHYAARGAKLEAYDGRETAPAGAKPGRFLGPDGRSLDWPDAVVSGKSVGVPGLLRLFELAHRRHGRLPRAARTRSTAARSRTTSQWQCEATSALPATSPNRTSPLTRRCSASRFAARTAAGRYAACLLPARAVSRCCRSSRSSSASICAR